MLRIHELGSLEAWITIIQILGIYGKNQPKNKLKHAAQSNKLSAVYSAEIYRTAQLNQHEWHRHKRLVGVLENKNFGYKSVCMPGKVNNGFNSMLNDIMNNLFQIFCILTSFSPWLYKIPPFGIFIPQPQSLFHEQLQ